MLDLAYQVGRGTLMGGADIIPGVSGGTVALVLGIYEQLITAVSHFDVQLLRLLRRGDWRGALLHADLPFLIPLGAGILLGFVIMTVLMHFLLSDPTTRSLTMAVFFGLITASGVLVALMIRQTTVRQRLGFFALGVLGAVFALWLAGLNTTTGAEPSLPYVFLCGAIAICAMILPGISGAMILLILGIYLHMTEIPKNILHGQHVLEGIVQVVVFASGCMVGLLSFSRLLRWLLANYHGATIAVLCGFMFGSLRKLWPFQEDLTPEIAEVKYKSFRAVLPATWDRQTVAVVAAGVAAAVLIFAVDWLARRSSKRRSEVGG